MSLVQSIDYAAISPALVLALTALAVLVTDLFVTRQRVAVAAGLSAAGCAGALAAVAALAAGAARATFCLPGGHCLYAADDFALWFQALFAVTGLVVVALSASAVEELRLPAGEFQFLLLSSLTGMTVLAAARDLITLVVALEVVSLPAFVLVGMRRGDTRGSEAALKFFLFSVLSTALTLYGASLLYGVTGSVQVDAVAAGLGHPGVPRALTAAAVVLVIAGFAFKVAAVPFHFWAPDTYQGAPLPVAAFLSVASKAAGFAGLLVVLHALSSYADIWGPVLAGLAAATMTVGNVAALRQRSVVRLLAWSSVAQAGYILVPLGLSTASASAVAATLDYLAIYAVMNLGAFGCAWAVGRRRPRNALDDYRGLARSSPLLALTFAFFLVCLAGLPPGVAGLVAKVVVLRAVVDGHLLWLAVVAAVNTVIGLAYYLRLVAVMFSGVGSEEEAPARVHTTPALLGGIALAGVATVALSVWPQAVLHLGPDAARLFGGS